MNPKVKKLIEELRKENVKTWFDLGLFLDQLKERKSKAGVNDEYFQFKEKIVRGGLGFLTFYYSIDGTTIEITKYITAFQKILPGVPIFLIGGEMNYEAEKLFPKSIEKFVLPEIRSFDDWLLYEDFFITKLVRGSKEYNSLITRFWSEVLLLTEKLAEYIISKKISLLYVVNVCSNPGNISLALATVLVSEYLGIPVINNNHDFYWEGGNKQLDIESKNLKPGPRDFFFTNAGVGEFFSLMEVLLPWDSRSWLSANINKSQVDYIIEKNGHNPANVDLLGTAVDTDQFEPISKRESIEAQAQVGYILGKKVKAIDDVITNCANAECAPFLAGNSGNEHFNFMKNNITFLQPTRILERKKIEVNFKLIEKLFQNRNFIKKIEEDNELKLTLIITGPVPPGQKPYYKKLLNEFREMLKRVKEEYRDKIFIGFLFSQFDHKDFRKKFKSPIDIPRLYSAFSLIMLPSENEGRGLPIIESAAAGKPVFCRRYDPEDVYNEVIGKDLDESLRLRVLEFKDTIPETLVKNVVQRIFYPQDAVDDVLHNESVVQQRFHIEALTDNLERILYKLFFQLKSLNQQNEKISTYIKEYEIRNNFSNDDLDMLINTKSREYLPGFGRLEFMLYLKSLIDPSFFRVEEQNTKGAAFQYALTIFKTASEFQDINSAKYHRFFNTLDDLFAFSKGEMDIIHDHSLTYRHRNKKFYPYRKYTFHELTGIINIIFDDIVSPVRIEARHHPTHFFFTDWNLALAQLSNSHRLEIDDRQYLFKRLRQKVPRVYFPGQYMRYEMEIFVLQPVRSILKLKIEEELDEQILKQNIKEIPNIYIFVHQYNFYKWYNYNDISKYLENTRDRELNLLYKYGIIKIVKTKQYCIGLHLRQLGEEALKILREIKEKNGFIITNGQSAAIMSDILDIDRFNIGKATRIMTAKMLGISINSGFIQYAPAGIRTTLAYPTPIQTSKEFSRVLNGKTFSRIAEKHGKDNLLQIIRDDAQSRGTPIRTLLKNLEARKLQSAVKYKYTGGVYKDGMPWSGILAEVDLNKQKWIFSAYSAAANPKPVTDLVDDFKAKTGISPKIAWNGGYILNPELVGKLGLPETYIGSPLGLLIMDAALSCPPLFNKPALLIAEDGSMAIKRVNIKNGFTLFYQSKKIRFDERSYNRHNHGDLSYYDLLYPDEKIIGDGNVIIRLAGNMVKEILPTKKSEKVRIIPVGLTLSIPPEIFNGFNFKVGQSLKIELNQSAGKPDWQNIIHAVEAGPLLVEKGKIAIDMELEGWKSSNSIKTQAARLDYIHMRGPKIAVGLSSDNKLMVLAVNGRIRESVGATHTDMAEILVSYGAQTAMGFDPGGSSTLVVDGKTLNISPYNKDYEKDIYSLPPQPRFVSNAVFGWLKRK